MRLNNPKQKKKREDLTESRVRTQRNVFTALENDHFGSLDQQGQKRGQPQLLRAPLLGDRPVLSEPRLHRPRTAGQVSFYMLAMYLFNSLKDGYDHTIRVPFTTASSGTSQ